MTAQQSGVSAPWDRSQWVGDGANGTGSGQEGRIAHPRWTRWQWVGSDRTAGADESATGDSGLSGWGHSPPGHRWA